MEADDSYLSQEAKIVPEMKEWSNLSEEIKHVDEYVNEIQQLIKDERYISLITLKDTCDQDTATLTDDQMIEQKRDLSHKLEDVKQKLRSVNEKYFTGKPGATLVSFGLGNYDSESVYLTPVSKLSNSVASRDEDRSGKVFSSVGLDNSLSIKQVSQSSTSSSSSDSESEQDPVVDKHLLEKPDSAANEGETGVPNTESGIAHDDSMLQKIKQALYEKFMERVSEYEKQLQAANEEIENSQEEISRLERKLTVRIEEVTCNMQSRLDLAHERVRELETELALEKGVVVELRGKVSGLETELMSRDCEIRDMGLVLSDARESFSREKSQFDAESLELFEQYKSALKKLEEMQLKVCSLEDQFVECESRYEVQAKGNLAEIERLRTDLSVKCEEVEKLNKSFDANKLDYDMLMVEKDEQVAKMEKLAAEIDDQGLQMKQMEARIGQLESERAELVASSEERERVERELRARVDELGKEMDRQSDVLFDRAEEKREAIRQLCLALEYYRNEYHDLCRVFPRKKRMPVLAA